MQRVLVYGAGSIGNHLTYSCRQKGWHVDITDSDPLALERTKSQIYPERYGSWDKNINLLKEIDRTQSYDLVIIGTPPDTHIQIAMEVLSGNLPKVLLIEKPLCTPTLENLNSLLDHESNQCKIIVGYNHNLTENTRRMEALLSDGYIGTPISMHARWLENWSGIFNAHPWLNGPSDTYLGFWQRGGGACAEHSHAISLWQHFARVLELGEVSEVVGVMDMCSLEEIEYDRTAQIILTTTKGFTGTVIQDVVTEPTIKTLRIQGEDGFVEWYAGYNSGSDALVYGLKNGDPHTELVPKTRPDDFHNQIESIDEILSGTKKLHPNKLEHGASTMEVVAAAHLSNAQSKKVDLTTGDWRTNSN
ncbi:MAG: Gfo/Idh/MocA family oxidoreductase [Chloroflexota bacterium]|nr:Gfo/Idh/MocA family oxidoreductase [Chloroflexota bacterium]